MSIPLKDSMLVAFSTNFNDRIAASSARFNLTQAQAEAYAAVHSPFVEAYSVMMAARAEGTRSEAQTAARDMAKAALIAYARELYAYVQASSSVSDADKVLLGVHVRGRGRRRIAPPTARPSVGVVSAVGRTITVHLRDSAASAKRGKPEGAVSAWVYTHAGETYPSDPSLWHFAGAFNGAEAAIDLPDSVPAGTPVWICAAWVNRRGQAGPRSGPVVTHVQFGGVSARPGIRVAA